MNGIINVYKEKGYTSHDVVAKLRGMLKERRIGHTGTLDPEAEGVLPVCIGKATKVCELLTGESKTYHTVLLLGVETDTQDLTGQLLRRSEVCCTEEELRSCTETFVGEQMQTPPMYSAVKVNGKRLYELARQGIEVERKARKIRIEEIRIDRIEWPEVELTVRCSRGTYIRTLCQDIGAALGCGGCMKSLLRTRVGPFSLENSKKLAEIETCCREGKLKDMLCPIDALFPHAEAVGLSPAAERLVRNGTALSRSVMNECRHSFVPASPDESRVARLYAGDGTFLALYEWQPGQENWRALKMFI